MEDLQEGMELEGNVSYVVRFWCIDRYWCQADGLVHISKLSKGYVQHPTNVVELWRGDCLGRRC